MLAGVWRRARSCVAQRLPRQRAPLGQNMKRRAANGRRHGPDSTSPENVPPRHVLTRRWVRLGLVAAAAAIAIAGGLAIILHGDAERTSLRNALAESASKASPASASLLREAGEVVDRLLSQFPENGEVLDVAAGLYQGLGKTQDAVRCWQRSVELAPALGPIAHAAMGSIAYDGGNLAEAATHYRTAMQQDPASSAYPVHLGEALIDGGKLPEAVEVLEAARRVHPTSMPISVLLGQAYQQLRQYEKARQHFELAVAMEPDYTNAFFGLGTVCARLGEQEKSKEYLTRFKELQAREEQKHRTALKESTDTAHTRDVVARTYRAASKVYLAFGEFQTAQQLLGRAREICPDEAESELLLAWSYEQLGRHDEAMQALDRVCEKAPDDLGAQMSAAAAYARLKRFEEAERAYRRAVELTPLRAGGYAALASFFLQTQRNLDEAGLLAEKAVALEPTAENQFLLSMSRRTRGDVAGDQQVRRELNRLMPSAAPEAGVR